MPKWQYTGDMSLEYGGFYWKDEGDPESVEALKVTPCSDAGGPDNLFHVESGTVYMNPERLESALDVIGLTPETASRNDVIYAFQAYSGLDRDAYGGERVIRIGPDESDYMRRSGGWNPEPDVILRAGTDLRKWIERNWLD